MTDHTCIRDDGGTPNRRCVACDEERDNYKAAWEASADMAKRQIDVAAEVRKERNAIRAERDAALALLSEVEFGFHGYCPLCCCTFAHQHWPGCRLDAFLAAHPETP